MSVQAITNSSRRGRPRVKQTKVRQNISIDQNTLKKARKMAFKPIMLFNWSGKPYRSKQIEIVPVIVEQVERIWIYHNVHGLVSYSHGQLWITEGFDSSDDMDEWFQRVVKRGDDARKTLMRFRLATPEEIETATRK